MREQKRLGHDVAAIIPALDGGIGAQLEAPGSPVTPRDVDILFAQPRIARKIVALFRLVRLLRRLRPDVVHRHIVNSVVTRARWPRGSPTCRCRLGANAHPMSIESEVLRPIEVGTAFCDTVDDRRRAPTRTT